MLRAALTAAILFAPVPLAAAEFFTLKGHGGPIKGIAVSPSGAILTASFDNSVGLWQGGVPRWLEAHEAAVNTVLFLDESRAVSGGDDFSLYHWDLATGAATRMGAHKGKVMALAATPDGATVASASWDGSIGLWSMDATAPPRFLTGHAAGVNTVQFSADGRTLWSGATDGTIRTWDVASGAPSGQVLNNGFGVNTLVLNEAGGWLAYGAVDGVTRIVDPLTGTPIRDLTLERRPILAMAINADFSRLAVGDGQGYISVIDTADWSYTADFRATLRGPIWALQFSPDGASLHAGGLDDAMYSWPVSGAGDAPKMVQEDRPFLQGGATASNGERQFNRKCSICHELGPDGRRRAGPTLHGVFGRRAGSLPLYPYSETLQDADIVWQAESIDALFGLGPDVYVAGTKMPMQRITNPQDRADLIDFLRVATDPETGGQTR
jgi:cytochrome c